MEWVCQWKGKRVHRLDQACRPKEQRALEQRLITFSSGSKLPFNVLDVTLHAMLGRCLEAKELPQLRRRIFFHTIQPLIDQCPENRLLFDC